MAAKKQPDKASSKTAAKSLKNKEKTEDKKKDKVKTKQPTKSRAKPPEEKKSPGRKPWIPDLDNIERWAMQGLDDKDIAALSGICPQRFCMKKGELSELKEALERGRAKGVQIASDKLLELVIGKDRDAIKFYLERKGGWKQQTENTNMNLNAETKDKKTIEAMIDAIVKVRTVGLK